MSEPDDRDLSAAFADLHAPRSTANYADRVPGVEAVGTVYARRWPQALATVLAVVVALGGAGTFLALRNARQGGVASSAGYPSARTNAAMAFDSTTGLTVMYGGLSASGSTLADTWTWDGSSWATSTGPSPGKLSGARMSDDPPDGGVLLIGVPQPANQGTGVVCAAGGGVGSGTSSGSTGSVAPSASAGVPLGSLQSVSPTKSGAVSSTLPPVISSPPITNCPTPVPYPTLQTWLFTAKGWTHMAGSTSAAANADTPTGASQLAYDSSTGQVVAVSSNAISYCGPPLRSGVAVMPDLVCPLGGAAQNGSTSTTPCSPSVCTSIPCRLSAGVSSCPPFSSTISTWTWSQRQWTQRKGAIIPGSNTGVVFGDAASAHATLVTETSAMSFCTTLASCPPVASPTTSVYTWVGSAWSQSGAAGSGPAGLSLAGATVASAGGHGILLTTSGQLYSWSAADASWLRQAAASQPDGRTGAAMAGGPGGSIVLFGGVSVSKPGAAVIGTGRPAGADTWTWNGSSWRHVAGASPPPVTSPSPCSDVTGLGASACAPPPGRVPPVAPLTTAAPKPSVPVGS